MDYDGLVKDFVTEFFPEFIAFANPKLYRQVDWKRGFDSLEQELINAMRGKLRGKGKRKQTDKLVRVWLRSGEEHFVFVHAEFQHQPEAGFAKRMYEYRSLISLRYDIERITAIAVFTGAPPPAEESEYRTETFGTTLFYRFNSVVAARQDEQKLAKSNNPFAIALLAAMYAHKSKSDDQKRLVFKSKVFEMTKEKQMPHERMVKLLIFVRDFIQLPDNLESEFHREAFSKTFPSLPAMQATQGSKDFAEKLYAHLFGFSPAQTLRQERRKMAQITMKAEQERAKAEQERAKAEQERAKAEQERAKAILNMHQKLNLSVVQIAEALTLDLPYVERIIAEFEKKRDDKPEQNTDSQ